jgi:membrane protease YdiL (CAAX protease family)
MIEAGSWHPIAVIGLVFSVVALALGVGTTYLAVRGYLRNRQRPMLFVTVGFIFVLLTPILLLFVFIFPIAEEVTFYAVSAINQTVGLCLILYGLRTPRTSNISKKS